MLNSLFKQAARRVLPRSSFQLSSYIHKQACRSHQASPYQSAQYTTQHTQRPTWNKALKIPINALMSSSSLIFHYPLALASLSMIGRMEVISQMKAMVSKYMTLRYRDMTIWTSANTVAGLFGHLLYQCEAPAFFCNNVDMQREFTYVQLGRDARRMLATPNAGGASTLSEVMSMELMNRLLGAQISKTEMELAYTTSHTPITDYSCILPDLDGQPGKRIAVSVTRAMAYRRKFKTADAKRLLTKKLRGVFYSNQTLMNEPIERQILHIWTPSGTAANIVRKIWYKMPRELLCNTIVLVSIVNSHWIFDNRIE